MQVEGLALTQPVAFITGASVRIGQAISRKLHAEGYSVWLHYRNSIEQAQQLADQLNAQREHSAHILSGHLDLTIDIEAMLAIIKAKDGPFGGRLDVLVNNASAFYPTPVADVDDRQWKQIINTNLRAPFLLSQGLANRLAEHNGCIVNITDIHAEKPMANHTLYSVSKAGLVSMTQSLAKELAPAIRTNAISPGAILWPKREETDTEYHAKILAQIPLERLGKLENIADTVWFIVSNDYVNGQVIKIDGGKSLS